MRNTQKISNAKWKALEVNHSVFKDNAQNFVGIEECTEYDLENTVTIQKVLVIQYNILQYCKLAAIYMFALMLHFRV